MAWLYIYYNFSSTGKNELVENILEAPIKNSNIPTIIFIAFQALTPGFASILAFALVLLDKYKDKDL